MEDERREAEDTPEAKKALTHAGSIGLPVGGPVEHTPWSRGSQVEGVDGRRAETTYDGAWQE
jgi:hypothetical protein